MSGPVFDVMGHLQLNLGLKTLTPTKFPFFVAVVRIPRRFALGIISNPDLSGLENSTYASNFSMLVFIEPLYPTTYALNIVSLALSECHY